MPMMGNNNLMPRPSANFQSVCFALQDELRYCAQMGWADLLDAKNVECSNQKGMKVEEGKVIFLVFF